MDMLLDNDRINILHIVARQYTMMYNAMNNIQHAKVTTAIPLDAELEAIIMAKVKELTGNDAILENVIDESIIGGFVLRVGDLQYDASVARNLDRLKRQLKDNTYVSKI